MTPLESLLVSIRSSLRQCCDLSRSEWLSLQVEYDCEVCLMLAENCLYGVRRLERRSVAGRVQERLRLLGVA